MFISDFAIKRPLITIVAMVALSVGGIAALLKLQTDEFPEVNPPVVTVGIIYPGAAPDGVEREILDPIEEAMSSIAGVKRVNGTAQDGFAQLLVEFQFEKPLQEATQDIRDAISAIRSDLPPEMEEPIIKKFNETDRPIVSLAVSSTNLSSGELTRLVDPGMTREFRSIPGVAEVTVPGKLERELTVQLRPDALQASGVSVSQVITALQLQNLAAPVGRVNGALDERSIRLKGRLDTPQQFAAIVVAQRDGQFIRLGQLADILDSTQEPRTLALFNGREAVGIDIKRSTGASTTEVSDKILERVDTLRKTLPAGTTIDVVKNSGVNVRNSVRNVEEALVEGALLTVLVVFLFLNSWRSTVITGLALPVSVLASFIAVYLMGYKLETMSLLGLSLAIGILIDDAIVVRENIVRHVEMGKDHYTAAREGTAEIGLAVAATTFSILAVFVPIGFVAGVTRQWMGPFALTMACSVAVSLLVSFSLDPMLSAYWPDPHKEEHEKSWITKKLDKFNTWFNKVAHGYKGVIAWALDHRAAVAVVAIGTFFGSFVLIPKGLPGIAVVFLGIAVAVFGLTHTTSFFARASSVAAGIAIAVVLVPMVPQWKNVGSGFFPVDDKAEMNITVETPPGSNLDYTRLKVNEISRLITQYPEVRYIYATLGGGDAGAVDVAKLYVKLTAKDERPMSADELASTIRAELEKVAGATAAVSTNDFGGGFKQIQIQLRGSDTPTLSAFAQEAFDAVKKVRGAVDLGLSTKGQRPELNVELNRGLASSLGLSVGQIAQALRPAFAGIDAGDWVDPSGETRDVVVRLSPEARRRASDLRQLPLVVQGPNGVPRTMPLGQVATITEGIGPAVINHLNRERVVRVEFNVSGRSTGEVTADALAAMNSLTVPDGVQISTGGEAEQQAEVFGEIFTALGIAVALMYLILVVQFGSFLDPLAIMLSLPLSLIGVFMALSISNYTINIMSLIGVILLMGIVAKNAILLIDFAKWSREESGLPLREALIEAGAIRLRPILMTTFALIAGMIPTALGSGEGAQFRAPLGVAVIGGVLTSTFLTLIAIPTFYEILDDMRTAFSRRLGLKVTQATAEHRVVDGLTPQAGD